MFQMVKWSKILLLKVNHWLVQQNLQLKLFLRNIWRIWWKVSCNCVAPICFFNCNNLKCYYGDRSTAYIFGEKGVFWYRNFYVLCFILAAVIDTTIVWNIAYVVVALVSIPNLIALFVLRKEVKKLSDEYIV